MRASLTPHGVRDSLNRQAGDLPHFRMKTEDKELLVALRAGIPYCRLPHPLKSRSLALHVPRLSRPHCDIPERFGSGAIAS